VIAEAPKAIATARLGASSARTPAATGKQRQIDRNFKQTPGQRNA